MFFNDTATTEIYTRSLVGSSDVYKRQVVSGAETVQQLEENVAVAKTFKKMSRGEVTSLLNRTKQGKTGVEIESYKRKPEAGGYPLHRDGEPA